MAILVSELIFDAHSLQKGYCGRDARTNLDTSGRLRQVPGILI